MKARPTRPASSLRPIRRPQAGYRWTSPKADDLALTSGTLVSVEVTEKVQAPIELVVPLIREAFGL